MRVRQIKYTESAKDQNGRSVTLRIKKVYFDQIASGEKKTEYRSYKDFYTRIFEGFEIKRLVLHYQSSRRVVAEVKRIDLIPRPSFLDAASFTSKVFAIRLGRILVK